MSVQTYRGHQLPGTRIIAPKGKHPAQLIGVASDDTLVMRQIPCGQVAVEFRYFDEISQAEWAVGPIDEVREFLSQKKYRVALGALGLWVDRNMKPSAILARELGIDAKAIESALWDNHLELKRKAM